MNKQEFIDRLSSKDSLSSSDKIEVCQHYLDNYPIQIGDFATGLQITIYGGSNKAIDFAYNQLKKRIEEFKAWTV
jgi:hypothetical protein